MHEQLAADNEIQKLEFLFDNEVVVNVRKEGAMENYYSRKRGNLSS